MGIVIFLSGLMIGIIMGVICICLIQIGEKRRSQDVERGVKSNKVGGE